MVCEVGLVEDEYNLHFLHALHRVHFVKAMTKYQEEGVMTCVSH